MKSAHHKRAGSEFPSNPPTPGVGSYDIRKSTDFTKMRTPAFRIGTSQRQSIEKINVKNLPGPANYQLDELTYRWIKNHSPRPFIGSSKRDELNRTINWPGPASYHTRNNFSTNKESYQKISIRGRPSPRTTNNSSPGPIYNTIEAVRSIKTKNPSHKIGTSPKMARNLRTNRNNPGPGAYNIQAELARQSLNMRSNFPRAKKMDIVQDNHSPGPG